GEAERVGGAEQNDAYGVVVARDREALEQLGQHLGVECVAGVRPFEADYRDPGLLALVAGQLLAHSSSVAETSRSTRRSVSVAAPSTSACTSSRGSRNRPSTQAETISGSVESGLPTPIRTRQKSGEPKPRLRLLRPLWPASPPPSRVRISPKGMSISS